MKRSCLFIVVMIVCLFPRIAYSMEPVRVLILPFEIHSPKELLYLQDRISELIKERLKQDGAVVIDILPDPLWMEETRSIDEIRSLGIKNGADYVVWGSLTWIGQKFSLDAKMVQSFGDELPDIFFAEGERIEAFPETVKELARSLGTKLFKHERVARVLVAGNRHIGTDAIKSVITTAPGDVYVAEKLSEDLRAIYLMGYFEDIWIEAKDEPEGKTIIFRVKEKPVIREIRIEGNEVYKDEEIKENLGIRTGSILSIPRIRSNIKLIEELYRDKNYHNVQISHNIYQSEQNQVDLVLVIEEGEIAFIRRIMFEGNIAHTSRELKGVMRTSEKGFFSWLTSSGKLDRDNLNQDIARLSAFYHDNGYIESRIGKPQIELKDNWIYITIKIDEGPQFKVGRVNITGDIILPQEELIEKLKITREKFYSRRAVRGDVLTLTDIYSNKGYAFANISPRLDKDRDRLMVNITYVIDKGRPVYFERINITGNTKTRDKVIRRELKVYEKELFSGERLKRSMRNLHRLGFFEDIRVATSKGSADDRMILNIDVTEKPTGAFSFGGGYSGAEGFFLMASISERNLFGRGQILQLKADFGRRTDRYMLSFTEPWLFDIPLAAGFDLYNWSKEFNTYDKDSVGGGIRLSYPVYDFTRVHFSYLYDVANIRNIAEDAPRTIWQMKGTNVTSSISTGLRYDSRDRIFNPTRGADLSINIEHAGLGGDIAFTKCVADAGWYIPLFMDTVGFLHARGGYVRENPGGKLPLWERFYLGGIDSLRGFDWHEISPVDAYGNKIGGDRFVQFNAEFIFPLIKSVGLIGVVFYDTGNVFDDHESIDLGNLRQSVGYGFRWYSPIGPIRLEKGYIINPRPGERKDGRWEFTMGAAF